MSPVCYNSPETSIFDRAACVISAYALPLSLRDCWRHQLLLLGIVSSCQSFHFSPLRYGGSERHVTILHPSIHRCRSHREVNLVEALCSPAHTANYTYTSKQTNRIDIHTFFVKHCLFPFFTLI